MLDLPSVFAVAAAQQARDRERVQWGNWRLLRKARVIFHMKARYGVDLDRMPDAAACLDWIFQVQGKTWCSREDIGHLLEALRVLVNPQANLCPWGLNRRNEGQR